MAALGRSVQRVHRRQQQSKVGYAALTGSIGLVLMMGAYQEEAVGLLNLTKVSQTATTWARY